MPISSHRHHVQGNVLRGYGREHFPCARFVFLNLPSSTSGAREWLRQIRAEIQMDEDWGDSPPEVLLNLGLTYAGLERLGVEPELRDSLPREYASGMYKRARDLIDQDPAEWEDVFKGRFHVLVSLYSGDEDALQERVTALGSAKGVSVLGMQEAGHLKGGVGHFGFVDGISQPELTDDYREGPDDWNKVRVGSVVLGHPPHGIGYASVKDEEYFARTPALLQNATFMVYMKMRQEVREFEEFFEHMGSETLAEQMLGRRRNGDPLIPGAGKPEPFTYEDDPAGKYCPLGAHIRRVNPRTLPSRIRRIVRRGVPYGGEGEEKGLIFIAFNASIRRQFEYVQKRWIQDGNDAGLPSHERDPLVGDRPTPFHSDPSGSPVAVLERFVTMRGGAYLLVPGKEGLDALTR